MMQELRRGPTLRRIVADHAALGAEKLLYFIVDPMSQHYDRAGRNCTRGFHLSISTIPQRLRNRPLMRSVILAHRI